MLRFSAMPAPFTLAPKRTAVLSMDLQSAIVSNYPNEKDSQAMLSRAAAVLERARASGMAVIHVHVGFRPNFPEISPRNALFSAIKSSPKYLEMFQGSGGAIHPGVAPQPGDIVVTKHRVSAFAGTDLDMILRSSDIETLVLFGIATSGVVLSTLLHASDADFRLVVIPDCCADLDPAVHSCLLEKIFPRRASLLSSADFLSSLAPPWS